ncbi:MAG: YfhO family protein [Bowdeniella nasicola]|nr:YfhO family protein [Bowdeniella nasicola]
MPTSQLQRTQPATPGRLVLWLQLIFTWISGLASALTIAHLTGRSPLDVAVHPPVSGGERTTVAYTVLWDILHGATDSSVTFNWELGLGIPFLGDAAAYTSNIFTPLVWFVERDQIGLALAWIAVLSIATAAVTMVAFLRALHGEVRADSWLWAVIYATSGWVLEAGSVIHVEWLNALIFLPLFALVAIWAHRRHHMILSVVIIALGWVTSFVAALPITLAGLLFTLAYTCSPLVTHGLKRRVLTLVRSLATYLLGIGTAAVVVLPVFHQALANRAVLGTPTPTANLAATLRSVFTGASVMPQAPNLFVSAITVAAVIAFIVAKSISWGEKLSFLALIATIAVSLLWSPPSAVWYLYSDSASTTYLPSFILIFALLVAAARGWRPLCREVPTLAIAIGATVALLLAVSWVTPVNYGTITPLVPSAIVLGVLTVVVLLMRLGARWQPVGVVIVAAVMLWAATAVATIVTPTRGSESKLDPETVAMVDYVRTNLQPSDTIAWHHPPRPTANLGALAGVRYLDYHLTAMPPQLARLAAEEHLLTSDDGHAVAMAPDLIASAMFGGTTLVDVTLSEIQHLQLPAVPFAYEYDQDAELPAKPTTVWQRREHFFQTSLYSTPSLVTLDGKQLNEQKPFTLTLKPDQPRRLQVHCEGSDIPQFMMHPSGVTVAVGRYQPRSYSSDTIVTGISHITPFVLSTEREIDVPIDQLYCTKTPAAFAWAKTRTEVEVERSGSAMRLKAKTRNPIAVTTTYAPQWHCTNATTSDRVGFLTVQPTSSGTISCHYQLVGLSRGSMISGTAFVLAVVIAVFDLRRKRRERIAAAARIPILATSRHPGISRHAVRSTPVRSDDLVNTIEIPAISDQPPPAAAAHRPTLPAPPRFERVDATRRPTLPAPPRFPQQDRTGRPTLPAPPVATRVLKGAPPEEMPPPPPGCPPISR